MGEKMRNQQIKITILLVLILSVIVTTETLAARWGGMRNENDQGTVRRRYRSPLPPRAKQQPPGIGRETRSLKSPSLSRVNASRKLNTPTHQSRPPAHRRRKVHPMLNPKTIPSSKNTVGRTSKILSRQSPGIKKPDKNIEQTGKVQKQTPVNKKRQKKQGPKS